MSEPSTTETDAGVIACYSPSGRVAWAQFAPLAIAGVMVSLAMGYLLCASDRGSPVLFFDALLQSIPVLGAIAVAVYVGRCRSRGVAVTLAIALTSIYYASAWEFGYRRNVSVLGPRATAWLAQSTGLPGALGYFLVRCDPTFGSFQSRAATIFFLALHALEFGLIIAGGIYAARWFAGRAFYENYGRWASSCLIGFERNDLPLIERAVRELDWTALDRVEKGTVSRSHRVGGGMILRIEYLPGAGDQPVYATIEGPRLWRLGKALAYVPLLHRFTRRLVRQRVVDAAAVPDLAAHLPGLAFGSPPARKSFAAQGALAYWSGDNQVREAGPSGLVSVLRESGLAGVTLVGRGGGDFRDPAVRATAAITLGAINIDVESVDASLCMTAENSPATRLRRMSLLEIVITYLFVAGNLLAFPIIWIGNALLSNGHTIVAILTYIAAGGAMLLSLTAAAFLLFAFRRLQTWILMRHFARRDGAILPPRSNLPRELIRIEDPATFHISKLTPEDWGVALLDGPRARLLIEGISHRYVIRGADVTEITPLRAIGQSVRLTYLIAGEPFAIVLNRYNAWATWAAALAIIPGLGLIFRGISQRGPRRWALRVAGALRVKYEPPSPRLNLQTARVDACGTGSNSLA